MSKDSFGGLQCIKYRVPNSYRLHLKQYDKVCKSVEFFRSLNSYRKPHKGNIMAEGLQGSPWEAVQALEAISKSLTRESSSLQVQHQADTEL